MTNDPNPQHLLRRPKKRQPLNLGVIAAVIGSIAVAGAIVGFIVVGHGRTAANASTTATAQLVPAAVARTDAQPAYAAPAKGVHHKSGSTNLQVAAAPSPAPTTTPGARATPTALTTQAPAHTANAEASARAKHLAALAASRRQHALALSKQSATLNYASLASSSGNSLQTPTPTQPAATAAPAASTPDAEPTPVYAPTVVVDARFADRVAPVYPSIAREQGVQGTAIVLATVGPTGKVEAVSIDQSTGNKWLDSAALDAARQSRFLPPEIDGKPATETYRIVYTFDPNE